MTGNCYVCGTHRPGEQTTTHAQCVSELRTHHAQQVKLVEEKAAMLSVILVEAQQENERLREALTDILRYCSEPIEQTHDLVEKDIFAKARAALEEKPAPAGDREWNDGH